MRTYLTKKKPCVIIACNSDPENPLKSFNTWIVFGGRTRGLEPSFGTSSGLVMTGRHVKVWIGGCRAVWLTLASS